jgi:hypothetical protein
MSFWHPKPPSPAVPHRPVAIIIEGVQGAKVVIEGGGIAAYPNGFHFEAITDASGWAMFDHASAIPAQQNTPELQGVTRCNLHIDHPAYKHYDQYLDLPNSRPDANPANWMVLIGGQWGVVQTACLVPPLPAMIKNVSSSVAWPIHRDGKVIRQADGAIFRWLGLTAFPLYLMYLNGDPLDVIDAWLRVTPGVTIVRVLGMVNSFAHLWPQEHADYYDKLRPFCDYLKSRWNLGVEFTVFADAAIIMPDRHMRDRHRDSVIAALAGATNVFIEACNEPNKDDSQGNMPGGNQEAHEHAMLMAGRGILCTSGAGSDEAIAAGLAGPDYVTIHPDRGPEWYRKNKDVLDVRDQTGLPCTADEPIGLAEAEIPGKRTANAQECATAGAVAQAHGLGSTIHSDAGISGVAFGPVQEQCARAWHDAAVWVPVDAQLSPFVRGSADSPCGWAYGEGPAEHRDDIDLRSYVKHGAFGSYLIQCHMPGQPYRDHVTPCSGWAVDQLGPSIGLATMKLI